MAGEIPKDEKELKFQYGDLIFRRNLINEAIARVEQELLKLERKKNIDK